MRRHAILAGLFALAGVMGLGSGSALAQRAAGSDANIDPLFLIDTPVAGLLPTTAGSAEVYLYPDGGMLAGTVYAPVRNLNVGLFFGGTRLIGSGGITWDPLPGFLLRYRLLEESTVHPAIIAGFDSQGRDGWIPDWKQYTVKSPGVFVAASKNYALYGSICFHGGLGYTIERKDGDYSPNMWLGMEKTVGPVVSLLAEYNFAFDNDKDRKGFWNGSLSAGARISTNIGLNIDIHFKNLSTSPLYYSHIVRSVRVQYVRYL